jgi:hypothetical protein
VPDLAQLGLDVGFARTAGCTCQSACISSRWPRPQRREGLLFEHGRQTTPHRLALLARGLCLHAHFENAH